MANYNERRLSRVLHIGNVAIGGDSPIAVQSMTNTDSHDFDSTYRQMKELEEAGCDIVRLTLPDVEACETVARLKKSDLKIPLVGDLHFNYKVALAAAEAGIDKMQSRARKAGAGAAVSIGKISR